MTPLMDAIAPSSNTAQQFSSISLPIRKEEVRSKLADQSHSMAILVDNFLSSVVPSQESVVSQSPRQDLKTAAKTEAKREMKTKESIIDDFLDSVFRDIPCLGSQPCQDQYDQHNIVVNQVSQSITGVTFQSQKSPEPFEETEESENASKPLAAEDVEEENVEKNVHIEYSLSQLI